MDEQRQAGLPAPSADTAQAFPVVGIGAAAGGLQALASLLENLPPLPGIALVVVLHLEPGDGDAVERSLQRVTGLPVVQVGERMRIRPNQVYVNLPGRSLKIEGGRLVAGDAAYAAGMPMTLNIFFRSLAEAYGERALAVVLSGTAADGVAGLASIKEHGGRTLAQLPDEAEERSMPQAAIDSGMVDNVLPAAALAGRLVELRKAMAGDADDAPAAFDADACPEDVLDAILAQLYARTGHDFRHYKQPTILRRIERRMRLRAVAELPAYYRLLQRDLHEPQALLQDLLIGVTNFFRDRDAFHVLEQTILPRIFHERQPGQPLRAWVAACSTGEEAYSLGMLLAERSEIIAGAPAMQIFATDVDERAIAVARAGRYPDAIAADLPAERLARYFVLEEDHFRVRKLLRDRILFAQHDLLHDPAFSNLDLITCRNVLIYLNREVHRHVLEVFHCALKPGGYLFLGSAESADLAPDLFLAVNVRHRLYQAKPAAGPARRLSIRQTGRWLGRRTAERAQEAAPPQELQPASFAELHERALARLAPPSLLLDEEGEVVHASSGAAPFLRYGGGEPSTRALALVLPELRAELRSALFQVQLSGREVRSGPVLCALECGERAVSLSVQPVEGDDRHAGLVLVRFEQAPEAPRVAASGDGSDPLVRELEEALSRMRENLQQAIEQAELSRAEVGKASAGLQRTVEKLCLTIEELEIDREELQSRNEELYTVNAELEVRVEETSKANDDLSNLIASTDIATLFLDRQLRIQRYTPHVARIFNIIPTDAGRPLAHVTHRLEATSLFDELATVFETGAPIEQEVRSTEGHDYIARVHPYRTAYDRIEGAVLTFFDISRRRSAEDALRGSEARLRALVTASSDILFTASADWSKIHFLDVEHAGADPARHSANWIEKYIPTEDRAHVSEVIARALATRSCFEVEHRVLRASGQVGWTVSRAIPLLDEAGKVVEWFGAGLDITERKRGEDALRTSESLLADELAKNILLQRLSTRLIPEQRPESLHEAILDAALMLTKADAAMIQLMDPVDERLRLVASRNIHPQAQAFLRDVSTGHGGIGARSLKARARVVIEDVECEPELAGKPHLEEFRRSHIRAIQSTPLWTRAGRLVGVLSTLWRRPHRLADNDFTLFDVLARQLADLIDRAQTEEDVRESEARRRADLERQLALSNGLLREALDASPGMVELFEAVRGEQGAIVDFRWVMVNARAAAVLGPVEGRRLLEHDPTPAAAAVLDTFRRVAETGEAATAARCFGSQRLDGGGWFVQAVVRRGDGVAVTTAT